MSRGLRDCAKRIAAYEHRLLPSQTAEKPHSAVTSLFWSKVTRAFQLPIVHYGNFPDRQKLVVYRFAIPMHVFSMDLYAIYNEEVVCYRGSTKYGLRMRFKLLGLLTKSTALHNSQNLRTNRELVCCIILTADQVTKNPIPQPPYPIVLFCATYNLGNGLCHFHSGLVK